MFESSPDAIFIEDLEGFVVDCNPAAASLHKTERSQLVGRHVIELIPPECRRDVILYSSPSPGEFESFSLTATGASIPVSIRISRIEYLGMPALLLHVREITEQRRLQEEMRRYSAYLEDRVRKRTQDLERANEILREEIEERTRAEHERRRLEEEVRTIQKMEAIGRLAGGVAHDFNNLLTVIIGRCERQLEKIDSKHPMHPDLLLIHDSATKAAGVTRQLLAFGRKQVLQLKVLDLNHVIRNVEALLRSLISENVAFSLDCDAAACNVEADSGQIQQVLTNLVVNALDAMPQGGRLRIQTSRIDVADLPPGTNVVTAQGRFVVLTVEDTGCGMDGETLSHAFEPFFSTKDSSKGTGLGLATVYGIVRQSGGYIAATSELHRGTTFRVYLPEVQSEPASPVAKLEEPQTGSETILLVEDSDVVRELTREILEARGYNVIEARDGLEALEICRSYRDKIHLTLTDVVMPHMNGREFADQAALVRPDMLVLLMSGYTAEIIKSGILNPGVHFIEKPFTSRELATKLRQILEPATARSGHIA